MQNDKYSIFRSSSSFFEFDSLKLAAMSNSFKTDFERIQFFENLKIEFDIASDFCKSHINSIKRCKKYLIEFEFHEKPLPTDKMSLDFSLKNIFTTSASWDQIFYSEDDFSAFTKNLSNFFSGLPYDNKLKINIKDGNILRLSSIIHDIYFDFSPYKCLKRDRNFLLIIKNLSIYSDLTLNDIYIKLIKR